MCPWISQSKPYDKRLADHSGCIRLPQLVGRGGGLATGTNPLLYCTSSESLPEPNATSIGPLREFSPCGARFRERVIGLGYSKGACARVVWPRQQIQAPGGSIEITHTPIQKNYSKPLKATKHCKPSLKTKQFPPSKGNKVRPQHG